MDCNYAIACDCCDWFSEFESVHISCKLYVINTHLYFSHEYGDGRMFLTMHFDWFIWVCLLFLSAIIGWGNLTKKKKTWKPCTWVEGVEYENYQLILIHTCKDFRPIYFSSTLPRSSIHMPFSLQRSPSHNDTVGDFSDMWGGNWFRCKTSARHKLGC